MKRRYVLSASALFAWALSVFGQQKIERVVAAADRVNLRAKPAESAEVVGQAAKGEALVVRSRSRGWVEVVPPARLDLWVHEDFVKDGVIAAQSVNVRAGAGMNFSIVGQLNAGQPVEVRGTLGEWARIKPPESCSLWVSESMVRPEAVPAPPTAAPPTSVPERGHAAAAPAPERPPPVQPPAPAPEPAKPPPDLKLVPIAGQGVQKQYQGTLRGPKYLFGNPSDFRLVAQAPGSGRTVTACYLIGNAPQLKGLLGRNMRVSGREYWVQGKAEPVLVVERITLLDGGD